MVVFVYSLLWSRPSGFAQDADSVRGGGQSAQAAYIPMKSWWVPASFIAYGGAGLKVKPLIRFNHYVKTKVLALNIARSSADNYTQYAPAALVYGLNAIGIKGRHNFMERSEILALAMAINAAADLSVKYITREERPDQSNNLSFPSGHTSTAFALAQFMFEEYRGVNFWWSISGYGFALYTGAYRLINNKHWAGDVVAGAGFGILSTEAAYWLYPKVCTLFHRPANQLPTALLMPYYQPGGAGILFSSSF